MKKISIFLVSLFMLLMPGVVSASSASISVSASNTVMLGNTVNVTVKISSSANIGSWQMDLNYDKSYLQLTKSSAESGGTSMAKTVPNGTKSKSYTFTFKALKAGSTKVSVSSYQAYDYNTMEQMSLSGGAKTISIKTKEEIEASYSDNAFLKSIKVDEYPLTPEFNKNTKEYTVEVENDVEKVNITASKEDGAASISGTGEKELAEGNNKFEIVCTAQKGNNITYVVNVYRKELNPIEVTVNNKTYGIIRKSDLLPEYSLFTQTTVTYEDTEVPALHNEVTGYTILGLKDEDGNIHMFIYENGEFTREYIELKGSSVTIIPKELKENKIFSSFKKTTIEINGLEIEAYVLSDKSSLAIIYAENSETGEEGYYSYNTKDETIQTFDEELIKKLNKRMDNYKYIFGGLIGLIVLLIIIVFMKKPKKKNINHVFEDELLNEEKEDDVEVKKIEDNKKKAKTKK